ncbi:MAG: hypothetical protein PVH91_06495 [Pseudomonadales bacterium]
MTGPTSLWEQTCVSYSLFGGNTDTRSHGIDTYVAGVELAALAWQLLSPGLKLVLFIHRASIPTELLKRVDAWVEEFDVLVVERGESRGRDGARWRFDAAWMPYRFVFTRDLDSLPRPDEVANMAFFQKSDRTLQLLRSKWHFKRVLAGLCGISVGPFRQHFPSADHFWRGWDYTRYGQEERRLSEVVRELGGHHCVEGHNSARISGSLRPHPREIAELTPRVPGYPDGGFAGKILTCRRISGAVTMLRELAGH